MTNALELIENVIRILLIIPQRISKEGYRACIQRRVCLQEKTMIPHPKETIIQEDIPVVVEELRRNLKPGEACPVCGSLEHRSCEKNVEVANGANSLNDFAAKLRKINAEIHRLSEPYMKYRRVRTDFISFQGTKWLDGVKQGNLHSFSNGIISNLQSTDQTPLVVGSMTSRRGNGDNAFFVCAADDPYDEHPATHTLTFQAEGRRISATGPQGPVQVKVGTDGKYSIDITSNQGILIEAAVY